MKKTLSLILVFAMSLSVLSGLVIFTSSAEKPFYADYDFVQLPGIQDWGTDEMTKYNAQAAKNDGSASGTPGELVNTHLKGDAKQAIKLTTNGNPNAWTIAFSTCGDVSNKAAQSQIGNVMGDYSNMSILKNYSGIRIAVENENGKEPSFTTWDKENSHIASFRLVGSTANSWNNNSYPYATAKTYYKCKEDPSKENTIVYADGYYYFYFKDFMDGWNSGLSYFEKYPNSTANYGNVYFWLQTGGINNAAYNGGAIYISDMQLFKEAEPLDFDALQDTVTEIETIDADGKYAEQIAAAKAVLSNPDVERSVFKAAKEALDEVTNDLVATINGLLDEADMNGFFEDTSKYYRLAIDSDMLINTANHTLKEYTTAIIALKTAMMDGVMGDELFALVNRANNLWIYNYSEESYYAARKAAMVVLNKYDDNDEELLPQMREAINALVPAKVYNVGSGTLFDGWSTDDVNDVVDINAIKLCDNIGTGLNTPNIWNNGDFSNNTTFQAGDGWFSMIAEDEFFDASMGWKSMDRDGTLAGARNGAFPVFGDIDIANADGIRFKMELSDGGSVDRVLIGLSNCKDHNMEAYAIKLRPASVNPDGYMIVPFSYFEDAWWASDKFADKKADSIIFIVEAYDVTEGTEIKFSEMTTFTYTKTFVKATEEQIQTLQKTIEILEVADLGDGHLDKLVETCQQAIDSDDFDVCDEAINGVTPFAKAYSAVKREEVKAKINDVISKDTEKYYLEDMKSVVDTYYNVETTADDMKKIMDICDGFIKSLTPPEAPDAPRLMEATYNTVTLMMAAKRIQYRIGEDGEWTSGNVFEGLKPDTEYKFYARYMPMKPTPASAPSEPLVVKTNKLPLNGSVIIEGTPAFGNVLTVNTKISEIETGELKYTWYRIGTIALDVEVGKGKEYTVQAEDIGNALYAIVTAEKCEGELKSDPTAQIAKGTPEIITAPESVVVPLGNKLGDVEITGAEVSCEGEWSWLNPDIMLDISQSGSTFAAVFTPSNQDIYETVQVEIAVVVSSDTILTTLVDENSGISITGEFLADGGTPELIVEDILPSETAYLDLLRTARNPVDIILLKNIRIGSSLSTAYIGTLTFKAYFAKEKAGESYNLWVFADGEVRSREVVVDANGYIIMEEITLPTVSDAK